MSTLKHVTCPDFVCCLVPFGKVPLEFRMPDGQLVQAEKFEFHEDYFEGEKLVIHLQPVVFGS